MGDSPDRVPDLRASDADRERVVDVLRRAASDGQLSVEELEQRASSAYAARTRRELEHLTADLGFEPLRDVAPAPAAAAQGRLSVREGPGGTRWVISIMGGHDKHGRWRLAPHCTVLNIMGGSDIDLNDAELSSPLTKLMDPTWPAVVSRRGTSAGDNANCARRAGATSDRDRQAPRSLALFRVVVVTMRGVPRNLFAGRWAEDQLPRVRMVEVEHSGQVERLAR